jgi:hypothetical protein
VDKFYYELENNKISKSQESASHNGKLYYKNPSSYYGPTITYTQIPSMDEDVKFLTPVKLENIELYENKDGLKRELIESQMQLSNLLLFSNEPKFAFNNTVKDNYALPYYDTTYEDKIMKINDLRKRIIEIRKLLNISDDNVEIFVRVENTTFPHKADDIMHHLNESYYHLQENVNQSDYKVINANLTSLDKVYDLRDIQISQQSKAPLNMPKLK